MLDWVQDTIRRARAEGWSRLDLGNAGLAAIPEEVWELEWLEVLVLGRVYYDHQGHKWIESANPGPPNTIATIPEQMARLSRLYELHLGDNEIVDVGPLTALTNLTTLDLSLTRVQDVGPLSALTSLTRLSLGNTKTQDVGPLTALTNLTWLDLGSTQVHDVMLLATLTNLTWLDLRSTQVQDVGPLATLTNLTWLDLRSTQVQDVGPLAALTNLIALSLCDTQVHDVGPLAALTNLIALDLSFTQVHDVGPLAALINLTSLYLCDTRVQDIGPLATLTTLTTLHLGVPRVQDVGPLAALINLTVLDLGISQLQCVGPLANHSMSFHGTTRLSTQVEDVGPLAALTNLTVLDLSNTKIRAFPHFILALPSLRTLFLYGTPLQDIPPEILGTNSYDNCLDAVRAHFADKAQGMAFDRAMKLILLGNGGVGKSSVVKRLVHNTFDSQEPSTHGIRLEPWTLTVDDGPIDIHIWDFGGQDIYHGTHALFLKSKALFLIVWDRDTEQQPGYSEAGLSFEHYPLQYWLDYVQHTSPQAPVLIVENKCDDGRGSGTPGLLLTPSVVFSAQEGHGRDLLLAHIRAACQRELANRGAREIGIGRWRVKDTLRHYLADDETRAPAERRYRTLSYVDFQALCDAQQGQVTSAHALLEYLHHSGVVFYQHGLFHDQIILDQRWAIDALYTIFDRQRCYRLLQSKGGRFTRGDLHDLAWGERFSEAEQQLLLSFMESCDLCFRISDWDATDPAYIAPDLLPAPEMVARDLSYRRQAGGGDGSAWYTYTHAFLHQGVMRRFIVEMGRAFRDTALYWRDGVYIDPAPEVQAMAIITCARRVDNNPARGRITIEVWGRERACLLTRIRRQLERLTERADTIAQAMRLEGQPWVDVAKLPDARVLGKVVAQDGTVLEAQPLLALLDGVQELPLPFAPGHQPAIVARVSPVRPSVYISYAWRDVRTTDASEPALVDRLYEALVATGYTVKRDSVDLGYKGLISAFMRELGRGDCVVVLISDAYLKSPFCMFELLEIYRHHEFHERICPVVLADARLHKLVDRLTYVAHWKAQLTRIEQLIQEVGFQVLSASGSLQGYETYREITYHADKLVSYLADINSQTPQLLEANDFATLKRAIDARLQALRTP